MTTDTQNLFDGIICTFNNNDNDFNNWIIGKDNKLKEVLRRLRLLYIPKEDLGEYSIFKIRKDIDAIPTYLFHVPEAKKYQHPANQPNTNTTCMNTHHR